MELQPKYELFDTLATPSISHFTIMHPELAPVAFIAAFSLFLPLPWHWRTGNIATLSIIAWLFISNIISAVDAVIWAGNVDIVASVWCDISTKLVIGANFALPTACLCLCIHLEQVSSLRISNTRIVDKRRRQYLEALGCFGLPVFFMALHYIVQGHRFDIVEDYGCRPTIYFSIPAIFIIFVPPILLAIATLIYAGLALRHFMRRRLSFAAHLNSQNSALTTSRYFRLILMSGLQMFLSILLTSYTLWFNFISVPIRPWTTWQDVHWNFSRIDLYVALFTPPLVQTTTYVLWWLIPAMTFLFVAFFSFGKDAVDEYKKFFQWLSTHALRSRSSLLTLKGHLKILPLTKSDSGVPDSRSTLASSLNDTTSTMISLSSKTLTSPSFINKSNLSSTTEYENDSEASYYPSPPRPAFKETTVVGSFPSPGLPLYEDVIDITPEPSPNASLLRNNPISPSSSNPRTWTRESGNSEISPSP